MIWTLLEFVDDQAQRMRPGAAEKQGSIALILCGYLQSLARFMELLI
jgi:hypothetical protein